MLGLSACLGDGYSYFRHTAGSSLTYFKLPTSWHTFSQSQILAAQGQQTSSFGPGAWTLAFDGSARPAVDDIFSPNSDGPTGLVRVRQLSPSEQDSYSLSDLRSELLGTDPLAGDSTPGKSSFNVLSFELVREPGGFHGMHMVVDVQSGGAAPYRLDQVSLLDGYSQWVYVLGVGCNRICFERNQGAIDQVVSSWTVKSQ